MDQNTQLKIEFFKLVKILNRSNLNINQRTEISFFIETVGSKSTVYATTNKAYKIQLVFKINDEDWLPCGFSGLINLEEKISNLMPQVKFEILTSTELTKKIKSFIFQQLN